MYDSWDTLMARLLAKGLAFDEANRLLRAGELLTKLRQEGFSVRVSGSTLYVRGPLTAEQREAVAANKAAILRLVS